MATKEQFEHSHSDGGSVDVNLAGRKITIKNSTETVTYGFTINSSPQMDMSFHGDFELMVRFGKPDDMVGLDFKFLETVERNNIIIQLNNIREYYNQPRILGL